MAVLYSIALLAVCVYGLNLYWMAWVRAGAERRLAGPVPPSGVAGPLHSAPGVTVQIPLYNEAHVTTRIIDACARLTYPNLRIQVLDDSTDRTSAIVRDAVVRWRSRGVAIRHIRRDHRAGFKAGALAHGLGSIGTPFVAVFDADFIPPPDFLDRAMAGFDAPDIGMVQARWEHVNAGRSMLTRLQAMALDAHFTVEQAGRHASGYAFGFNGTAGIWRVACIEDAGGWSADTLTEDLDLSYRAQLKGWRFVYRDDIGVPAELPEDMSGFRMQQQRWAQGTAQAARKLLGPVLRSTWRAGRRIQAVLHLTAHGAYPLMIVLALLHAPLMLSRSSAGGPGELYFAALSVGILGFAGLLAQHVTAQRILYADWARRLVRFPVFLAGSIGMSVTGTGALAREVFGVDTPFLRTPKYNSPTDSGRGVPWWRSPYARRKGDGLILVETALALYSAAALVAVVRAEAWAAVPFQALFAASFALIAGLSLLHVRLARRAVA